MENFGNKVTTEKEIDFEREAKIRETINLISLKRNEEKKIEINELVKELAGELPLPLQEMIMGDHNSIKELIEDKHDLIKAAGKELTSEEVEADENILRKATELSFTRLIAGYETKLTDKESIPNAAYAMVNAMEKIGAIFEKEEIAEDDFKKIARVSFDVNGLKAVNDLNGGDHKKGDVYLALAAKAIRSDRAIKYAQENGINFEPERVTRDGGDEFSIIVTSETAFNKNEKGDCEVLSGFISEIQESFWNDADVPRVLDFESPSVLASYAKTSVAEIKEKFGGNVAAFKEAYNIPKDYKYHGALAGGAATIHDSLMDKKFEDKNAVGMRDKYKRMLQKTIGAMFSSSDREMNTDKEEFKQGLVSETADKIIDRIVESGVLKREDIPRDSAEAEALSKRFLAKVYSRTDKEKELVEKVDILGMENSELKSKMEKIKTQIDLITATLDNAISENNWGMVKKASELLKNIGEGK
jgi:GGDEF domain-containing protein